MLNFTPSFPTHLTLLPSSTTTLCSICDTDNEGYDQFITVPLCHSFLLTLSPCSNADPCHGSLFFKKICSCMSPLHGLQSFRVSLLQHGFSMGCSSFRAYPLAVFSGMVLSIGLHGISALVSGVPPLPPSPTLVLKGLFLLLFLPHSLSSVLPFLKYITTKTPPFSLIVSAMSCGGSFPDKTGHVQHSRVPGFFSYRSALQIPCY